MELLKNSDSFAAKVEKSDTLYIIQVLYMYVRTTLLHSVLCTCMHAIILYNVHGCQYICWYK
jgi:hypothetical protein